MREILNPPAIVEAAVDMAAVGAELDGLLDQIEHAEVVLLDKRVRVGELLLRVRKQYPDRGAKAKAWGDFVRARKVSLVTATRYMKIAEYVAMNPEARDMPVMAIYERMGINASGWGRDISNCADGNISSLSGASVSLLTANNEVERSKLAPLLSSESTCWLTPEVIRDLLLEFAPEGIVLDPCSHPLSIIPAAVRWTGPDHGGRDGLTEDWIAASNGGLIFVNPPYGRPMEDWGPRIAEMARALPGGHAGIIALPAARTGAGWWDVLMGAAAGWCGWKGRLRFLEPTADWIAREQKRAAEQKRDVRTPPTEAFPGLVQTDSATFDSALIYFGPRWQRFAEVFGQRGQLYPIQRPGYQPLFPDGPGAELAGLPRSKEDPADAHATPDRQVPAVRQEAGPPAPRAARPSAADPDAGRRDQGPLPQVRSAKDADDTPWEGPLTDCFLRGQVVVKTNGTPAVLYFVAGAAAGTLYVRDYFHQQRPPRTLPAATAYGPGWLDLIGGAKVRRVTADQAAALAKLDEAGRADALRSMFAAPLPAELARLTQEAPAAEPDPAPAPRLDPDAAKDRQRQAEQTLEDRAAVLRVTLRAALAACPEADRPGLRAAAAAELGDHDLQQAIGQLVVVEHERNEARTEAAALRAELAHPQDADVTPERDQVEEWIGELTTLTDGTEVASAQEAWQRGHDAGWAARESSEGALPPASCGTCEIREAELQQVLGRSGVPWRLLIPRVRGLVQSARGERHAAEQTPPAMATAQTTYLGGERVRLTHPFNMGRIWPKGHGAEVRQHRGGEVSVLLDDGAGLGVVEVPVDHVEPEPAQAEPLKPDTADGSYPPGWRVLLSGRPAIVLGKSAKPGGDTPICWLRRTTKRGAADEVCAHPLELQPVPGPQDRLAALQEVVDQSWPPAPHAAEVVEGVEAALRELGGVVPAKGESAVPAPAKGAPRKKGGRRG